MLKQLLLFSGANSLITMAIRLAFAATRQTATDMLHGLTHFRLGTVGAARAHCWETRSGAVPFSDG